MGGIEELDVSSDQPAQDDVQHLPGCAHAAQLHKNRPDQHFEVTVLLPPSPYGTDAPVDGTPGSSPDGGQTIAIMIPVAATDVVSDLRNVVYESAEGFWLGAFAFVRVPAEDIESTVLEPEHPASDEPAPVDGSRPDVPVSNWAEVGTVFSSSAYADSAVPRILRVVDAPAEEAEVRTHILRLRDVINNASSALVGRLGYDPTPYDPSAPAVDAGLSVYTAMRASPRASSMPPQELVAGPSTEVVLANGHSSELEKAKKRRSHNKTKSRSRQLSQQPNGHVEEPLAVAIVEPAPNGKQSPEPASPVDSLAHAYADFTAENVASQPLGALLGPREEFRRRTKPPPAVSRIALSVWNPPPPQLRLRGHLMYITVQLVEGSTLSITATPAGYVVNQSDETHFNPTPRPPGSLYASLFSLLVAHSPRFESAMRARFALPPITQPDAFASVALQNHAGAAPWLVDVPSPPASDALRHQLAYLATGSLGPGNFPTQRDWNDEFVAIRELPKSEINDRIMRDRMLAKLHADYTAAAVRQVMSVARGEVAPINPSEPYVSRTYVSQQILLLPAEDTHQAMTHMGGEEAVRVTVAKDVKCIQLLNAQDIDGLHTTGTIVVDFMGERWTAQALLPGLLGPARLDPDAPEGSTPPAPAPVPGCGVEGCAADTTGDSAGFRIVYGSEETENPEQSIAADERFHKLAAKVAEPFHLALHTVKDIKGKASELWLSSDVKGVLGTDGRSYLIDLCASGSLAKLTPTDRLQCVDVCFLENDMDSALLGSQPATNGHVNGVNGHANGHAEAVASPVDEQPPASTSYPHRVVLLRPELVHVFRNEEFKRWIGESMARGRASGDAPGSPEQPKDENEPAWLDVARRAHQHKSRPGKPVDASQDGSEEETEQQGLSNFWTGSHSVINLEQFGFVLNPDAFVDRRPQPGKAAVEPNYEVADDDSDARSSLLVRAASLYLRESAIPDFANELITSCQVPQDGRILTKALHGRGINMRYLGRFAEALDSPPEVAPAARSAVAFALPQIKAAVLREMLVRGAKHVYRRLLKDLPAPEEAAPATAHFLNCLLGRSVNASPQPDLVGLTTPPPSRPRTWTQLTPASLQRIIVLEVQRRFRYTLPDSSFTPELWPVQFLREFSLRVGLQLRLRNYVFTASTSSKPTVFEAEDVINLIPIVKDTPHKCDWLDNVFDQGVSSINRGQIQQGEAQVNEALAHYENIFGSVHPELATRYHELAVVYHQLAQPLNLACSTFENAHADPSTHEERQKAKLDSGLEDQAACDAARRECKQYVESAVRMNRQATIVCERCHGLDSYEALNYIIDLAILEHANDSPQFALKLSRHALALSTLISGPAHSDVQRILGTASQMLSAWQGPAVALSLHRETVAMIKRARGPESVSYAQTLSMLAKCLGNPITRDYAGGLEVAREAAAIFRARFGPDEERTKETEHLAEQLEKAAAMKDRSESGHVSRMARLLRTDESRVRQIIAKNQRTASNGSKKLIAAAPEPRSDPPAIQSEPSLAHLDIDDLVKLIEGDGKRRPSARR